MNNAARVRRPHGAGYLAQQMRYPPRGERALLDKRRQRLSVQELHGDEAGSLRRGPRVEDLDDIGMGDAARRVGLAGEATLDLGVAGMARVQDLDRRAVAGERDMMRLVDHAEAPPGKRPDDPPISQHLSN